MYYAEQNSNSVKTQSKHTTERLQGSAQESKFKVKGLTQATDTKSKIHMRTQIFLLYKQETVITILF